MKVFRGTVLVLIVFLGVSAMGYAQDVRLNFRATLTGAQEVPETGSPASGEITVRFDKGFTTMDVNLRVTQNTDGAITRAHFHCNRPGENGPIILGLFVPGPFPISNRVRGTVTNANVDGTADCPGSVDRVINNLASLALAMREGLIYANVHSEAFPGGEIRGQMIEDTD
jgi:hypothetical protein